MMQQQQCGAGGGSTQDQLRLAVQGQGDEAGNLHQFIAYGWTHVDPRGVITTGGPVVTYSITSYDVVNAMWELIAADAELQALQAEFYAKIAEKLVALGAIVQAD